MAEPLPKHLCGSVLDADAAFARVSLRTRFLDTVLAAGVFGALLLRLTTPASASAAGTSGGAALLGDRPLPRIPPARRAGPPEEPDPALLSPSPRAPTGGSSSGEKFPEGL